MPEALADLSRLSLTEIAELAASKKLPPVESWTPARQGKSEMRIARDGKWFHQGNEITRPNMVRLFSTILRLEKDGRHALVTPVEKLFIEVEDTPFNAVELKSEGEGEARKLAFRLTTGDVVVAGQEHPLLLESGGATVEVRGGMMARVTRAPWFELAELALAEANDPPGLWSDGAFFAFPAV